MSERETCPACNCTYFREELVRVDGIFLCPGMCADGHRIRNGERLQNEPCAVCGDPVQKDWRTWNEYPMHTDCAPVALYGGDSGGEQ